MENEFCCETLAATYVMKQCLTTHRSVADSFEHVKVEELPECLTENQLLERDEVTCSQFVNGYISGNG